MFVIEFLITILNFVFELAMSVMYLITYALLFPSAWLGGMTDQIPACSLCLW
jgi:hypothetical protein